MQTKSNSYTSRRQRHAAARCTISAALAALLRGDDAVLPGLRAPALVPVRASSSAYPRRYLID
jgi:hypothetical protein